MHVSLPIVCELASLFQIALINGRARLYLILHCSFALDRSLTIGVRDREDSIFPHYHGLTPA